MPRRKVRQLGAVNIVLHPHSPTRYADLWRKLFSLEKAVRVRGDTYAMIGTLHEVDSSDPTAGFTGSIFRFTKIDKEAEWLDLRSAKPAAPDVVEKEVRVPDYLQPNLRLFNYFFDIKKHRAVIETKGTKGTLSPVSFEEMLHKLFELPEIAKAFPGAEATTEQSREVLKTILRKGGLKHLKILVKRPNPDGGEDDERKVLEELSNQNAKSTITELTAESDKTLEPNKRTRVMAKVATSNGYVEGTVLDDRGRPFPVSSKDHPHKQPYTVEPMQSLRSAFLDAANALIRTLLS